MNLKSLNLWPMLSLLYMQFSAAVPNDLFQRNDHEQTKTEIVVPGGQVLERQHSKDKNRQMIESCQLGYLGFVKSLVEKGVNINVCEDNGLTPLMEAAHRGYYSIVKYLVYIFQFANTYWIASKIDSNFCFKAPIFFFK